jgi:pimeloyl-ACP methyl ester carboxylesterase
MADVGEDAARVVSTDGTEIAYRSTGQGPPLVLVHGAPADHTRWQPLLPFLEPVVTVLAMDRRGRGASADGPEYRLAREFEDVAAVVDAAAELYGQPVDVYGHSFGGLCAFGAAALSTNVHRLVLYEGWPSVDPAAYTLPPEVDAKLDELLASGERDAIVATVLRELAGLSDRELEAFRALPAWRARVAAAHTLPRELRAIPEGAFSPPWAARVVVPTLLIVGSDSSDPATADTEALTAAMPHARVLILEGQGHVADVLAPELFSHHLMAFLHPN